MKDDDSNQEALCTIATAIMDVQSTARQSMHLQFDISKDRSVKSDVLLAVLVRI
jgi:hypothetical protein